VEDAVKTIWKYRIEHGSEFQARSSERTRIVHFAMQDGLPTMWAEMVANDCTPTAIRTFEIFGTGHEIPDHAVYIGTTFDCSLVWHLYETTPKALRAVLT
jgi:hypothetical protein